VTVEEVREQTRDLLDEETSLIERYIKGARLAVEKLTTRKLITQTLVATMDEFPDTGRRGAFWSGVRVGTERSTGITSAQSILLDYLPVQQVDSLATFNDADVETVFSAANYRVDLSDPNLPARISLKESGTWPTDLRPTTAVKITYIAGYGDAAAVPEDIKLAIAQIVAHWCANREAVAKSGLAKVPLEFEDLLEPYTLKEF
jgi:hypothetical protein